jgi:putative transposase
VGDVSGPSTRKPNATWMKEQAGKFVEHVRASGQEVTLLLRDRDVIYGQGFDKTIRDAGIQVKKNSVRAPNLQAHVERFVQSIQQEALDDFIVFGEQHFDHLVSQYVEHYHTERPHQAKGNVPLTGEWPDSDGRPPDPELIVCRTRLGGLLKHYERRAA